MDRTGDISPVLEGMVQVVTIGPGGQQIPHTIGVGSSSTMPEMRLAYSACELLASALKELSGCRSQLRDA